MKTFIPIPLFMWVYRKLEKIKGERWDYEAAPYCGHHYCGHRNFFAYHSLHEGDGIYAIKIPFGELYIYTDEDFVYYGKKEQYNYTKLWH